MSKNFKISKMSETSKAEVCRKLFQIFAKFEITKKVWVLFERFGERLLENRSADD